MRGGALPPALLFAAFGLALAFAPRRAFAPSLLLLAATAVLFSFLPATPSWRDPVFMGCWISVAITALAVHLPARLGLKGALLLALNAGAWGGTLVASSGTRGDLLVAAPAALLCLPGAWLVSTRRQIVLKVLASWLVAISLLAGTLQVTTPTPGYAPDHMD